MRFVIPAGRPLLLPLDGASSMGRAVVGGVGVAVWVVRVESGIGVAMDVVIDMIGAEVTGASSI